MTPSPAELNDSQASHQHSGNASAESAAGGDGLPGAAGALAVIVGHLIARVEEVGSIAQGGDRYLLKDLAVARDRVVRVLGEINPGEPARRR